MKFNDNPITCGRRNCADCGRWRHAIEFRWRWGYKRRNLKKGEHKANGVKSKRLKSRRQTPTIDTVCNLCRTKRERQRYENYTPEQKRAVTERTNRNNRLRRQRLEEQIRYARMAHSHYSKSDSYDITPFRMWLLRQVRVAGSPEAFAEHCGGSVDAREVRRYCDGYIWEGSRGLGGWDGCEPTPLRSVSLATVDRYAVAIGDPGMLDRLYPYAEAQESA